MKKLLLIGAIAASMLLPVAASARSSSNTFWLFDEYPTDKRLYMAECIKDQENLPSVRRREPNVIDHDIKSWARYYMTDRENCECSFKVATEHNKRFAAIGIHSMDDLGKALNSNKADQAARIIAEVDPICGWMPSKEQTVPFDYPPKRR